MTRMAIAALLAAGAAWGQPVIGAKAGIVSFVVGPVEANGKALVYPVSRFAELKEGEILRTRTRALAEVLLGPCSVVRIGGNSSLRLVRADVTHPRVELMRGAAIVEIAAMVKGGDVTLAANGADVTMARSGLYRVNRAPAVVKVYAGKAKIGDSEVGSGRTLSLPWLSAGKVDRGATDELDRWSGRRSAELYPWKYVQGGRGEAVGGIAPADQPSATARVGVAPRGRELSGEIPAAVQTPQFGCVAGR